MARRIPVGRATRTALYALAATTALSPVAAWAQNEPAGATAAESAAAAADDGDEIIVTAQKRAENVQDVPKPVDVISNERLTDAGVTRVQELARVAPSISGTIAPVTGVPAIRGISSFSISIGLQGQTGIVLDDVPQPAFSSIANELGDVERIEVFPGPQSSLSGRNTAGGLINIVTLRPSHTFKANAMFEQTDDHQTRAQGFVTGPIGEQFAFSVSGFFNDWDGLTRNIADNDKRLGGWHTYGGRAKLLWEPSSTFDATLTGYYVKNRTAGPALLSGGMYTDLDPRARFLFAPGIPLEDLFPGLTPGPFNRDVSTEGNSKLWTKDRGVSLRLNLDTGNLGTLSSISNWSRSDLPRVDYFIGAHIGLPDPLVHVTYESELLSQEIRLVSPGNQPFTYLLGAIYSDNDIFHPYQRLGFFPVNWIRESGFTTLAVFGRGTYEFGGSTFLTGGLRYQHDKQSYDWTFMQTVPPFAVTARPKDSSTYDFLSGEVSLRHEFTDDISAYVTVSKGQTGEAYDFEDQVSALSPAGLQPIDSEKVTAVEVGLKTQSVDRRWTANVNFFWAKYSNFQIQTLSTGDANSTPVIRVFPIGKVENKGIEFTGTFRPEPDLSFMVNAAYLDAVIKDYPNAACYARQTPDQGCVDINPDPAVTQNVQVNLSGLTMPNSPKFRVNGMVDYKLRLDTLPFDVNFNLFARYQTKQRGDLFGNPLSKIGAYGIVNASIGFTDHDEHFELTLFANNLFDKNYYQARGDDNFLVVFTDPTVPARTATYARDSFRYFGVRLRVKS